MPDEPRRLQDAAGAPTVQMSRCIARPATYSSLASKPCHGEAPDRSDPQKAVAGVALF
jgi:hypothetical protein